MCKEKQTNKEGGQENPEQQFTRNADERDGAFLERAKKVAKDRKQRHRSSALTKRQKFA